ncbi:MAG TPA: hypothetical protein VHW47_00785 [Acidimicrobiales bacterium]|jgi:hypothetical protein|nr:hypothetical protein [Acidimicrobiales bacterium]
MGSATPVIVGALLFLCLVAALAVGLGWWAWRHVRRYWLVARAATRSVEAAWLATRSVRRAVATGVGTAGTRPGGIGRAARWAGGLAAGDLASVDLVSVDLAGLAPGQLRRQMWRGVEEAERAVRQATAAGAPVGQLPSLCGRMRSTAAALDELLSTGASGEGGRSVRRQAAEVVSVAAGVGTAARASVLATAGDATELRVRALVDDTEREVESLATGLGRSRPAVQRP